MNDVEISVGKLRDSSPESPGYFIIIGDQGLQVSRDDLMSIADMIRDLIDSEPQDENQPPHRLGFKLGCDEGSGVMSLAVEGGRIQFGWREGLAFAAKVVACVGKSSGIPLVKLCSELGSIAALVKGYGSQSQADAALDQREFTL